MSEAAVEDENRTLQRENAALMREAATYMRDAVNFRRSVTAAIEALSAIVAECESEHGAADSCVRIVEIAQSALAELK
jgi:hypothetical protein